jgi:hypothetical protein
LVGAVVWSIPVDYDAIDPAADHICNLAMNLRGIGGVVTDVHVVRASEPQHQMCVDLGRSAGIQQGVHIDLAGVSGRGIAITLIGKTAGCTRIIRRLGG